MIYTKEEYVTVLQEFFKAVEHLLFLACEWEEGKDLIESIVDRLISKVGEEAFILNAMNRAQKTRGATPWAYESGGSVDHVVTSYFRMVNLPKKVEFIPKTPHELLCQLIEWTKDAPYPLTNRFTEDPMQGMLMTSPNHAFVFKPGLKEFREAWTSNANTYTFVRDAVEGKFRHAYLDGAFLQEDLALLFDFFSPYGMPQPTSFSAMKGWARKQGAALQTLFNELCVNLCNRKSQRIDFPFADTNWESDLFTFVLNPLTEELELWRKSGTALRALPSWRGLFQEKSWQLYADQFIPMVPKRPSLH